jgi:hypothetical protein
MSRRRRTGRVDRVLADEEPRFGAADLCFAEARAGGDGLHEEVVELVDLGLQVLTNTLRQLLERIPVDLVRAGEDERRLDSAVLERVVTSRGA